MSAPIIPDSVRAAQSKASDPMESAWVSANAGAGKTHVLAQRVIRLLLSGVDPARILCITFTKAAAANMANRVFDELRAWTALDDTALDVAIRALSNAPPSAKLRARARQLFALALETPGGLKVQTIHAFCTHLLHLFPFEADVAARFNVLDETEENRLLDELTLRVLLEAAEQPQAPLGRALATAIAAAADITFRELLREVVRLRDPLARWTEAAGGIDEAVAQLSYRLDVDPRLTREQLEAEIFNGPYLPPSEWRAVAALLATGSASDRAQAERLTAAASTTDENARLDAYVSVFIATTAARQPRQSLITGPLARRHPSLAKRLADEQARIVVLDQRHRGIVMRDRTAALVRIASEVLKRFQSEKDTRGLLDYEDLIDKALALLTKQSAAWVHYKLDRGIDHVLIDEAQDTSPKQWAIVRALIAEFFAGMGAHDQRRTIFAVGDEKQSIFSFQGAAPREFDAMYREFAELSRNIGRELHHVRFAHSFRSGEIVLSAVDAVFRERTVYAGVTNDADGMSHSALPEMAPGLVEIWDIEKPSEKKDMEAWDAPFDTKSEANPVVKLAARIATAAQGWIDQGRRPGDMLVLVRRRGALFEAVIRALKNRAVAVAGADRLVLTEHIAVLDLMVLADALLLPEDDLALATVLRSPLFGFSDEALFALAWDRRASLRATLRTRAADDPQCAAAAARLDQLAEAAASQTPFMFYAQLLGAGGARKRMLARLGNEASDALDEFLNLAIDYERSETPSLQGFVAWLRAAKSEVKRDMEIVRDEVRVMTVHGAKGLEAPIVILADTTTPPEGWHPPRLLALAGPDDAPDAPKPLVWAGPKANDVGAMAAARAAALGDITDEYRRLLYVAMTRAKEHLVICGADNMNRRPEACWYNLICTAIKPLAVEQQAADGEKVWIYQKAPRQLAATNANEDAERPPLVLPSWLTAAATAEPARADPLTPSRAFDEAAPQAAASRGGGPDRKRAKAQGVLVHRLLQHLPDLPPERRRETARRHFATVREPLSDHEREAMIDQVLAVLGHAQFATLFAPGSRAEISITGMVGDRTISGQVDRLAVTPDTVLIADYKTNRPAPRTLTSVPEPYIAQLALYRAVLSRLYPDRPVKAAVIWTETLELMEIPGARLDAALEATLQS